MFFNVDTSVGRGGANSDRNDILLVQFLLKTLSTNVTTPAGQSVRAILAATPQTGSVDPLTIRSIEAYQGAKNSPVDGRVSSARGYSYGAHDYTIVLLNFNVREDHLRVWPRLDQIPNCPGELRQLLPQIL